MEDELSSKSVPECKYDLHIEGLINNRDESLSADEKEEDERNELDEKLQNSAEVTVSSARQRFLAAQIMDTEYSFKEIENVAASAPTENDYSTEILREMDGTLEGIKKWKERIQVSDSEPFPETEAETEDETIKDRAVFDTLLKEKSKFENEMEILHGKMANIRGAAQSLEAIIHSPRLHVESLGINYDSNVPQIPDKENLDKEMRALQFKRILDEERENTYDKSTIMQSEIVEDISVLQAGIGNLEANLLDFTSELDKLLLDSSSHK